MSISRLISPLRSPRSNESASASSLSEPSRYDPFILKRALSSSNFSQNTEVENFTFPPQTPFISASIVTMSSFNEYPPVKSTKLKPLMEPRSDLKAPYILFKSLFSEVVHVTPSTVTSDEESKFTKLNRDGSIKSAIFNESSILNPLFTS